MMTMAQPSKLISHEISASNLLMGASRFITLWLPPAWDLAPGVGRPEIVAAHKRSTDKWVASGRAWYVIYNKDLQWVMELKIDVGRAGQKLKLGSDMVVVNGHEGQVRWWERGRGIFRRQRITYMEAAFVCPQSDRSIRLEFSGRCELAGFQAILGLIPHWRCH